MMRAPLRRAAVRTADPGLASTYDHFRADCGQRLALGHLWLWLGQPSTIYVLGGYDGSSRSYFNTAEAYDPHTNTWTSIAPMGTARTGLAATAVNGTIYALGGSDALSRSYFNTAEAYNPSTNTWTTIASMGTARVGMTATALNGKIYALGGYDGSSWLNTAEAYDPSTNTWTTIATKGPPRGAPTAPKG
jgi:N-acetylneuraminic acid mutarotase